MRGTAALVFAAVLAALPAAGAPSAALGKDLGVRGATWPVAEPDLLAQIEARLLEMQRSGALARFEDEARERARRMLEEPDPVPGIAPAREERNTPVRSRRHGRAGHPLGRRHARSPPPGPG